MIYNVTRLYDKYKLEIFKHYLSINKLQIFYSDVSNDFSLNLIESCDKNRKRLVLKIIKEQMKKNPIVELTNCPKVNMESKAAKRRRMFLK